MAALGAERCQVGVDKHLSADLDEMGFAGEDELWDCLPGLLTEIRSGSPVECYAGTRPPQKSYEPGIEEEELWAYSWFSDRLQKRVYLKFVIIKDASGEPHYLHVRLHPDRPKGRKKP